MQQIKGKVALITGGTKGIGYGIAEALLNQGVHVAITGRNQETAKEVASNLAVTTAKGADVIGIGADVKSFEDQQKAVAETVKHFGQLDVVIANAGLGHFGSIMDLSVDQWQDTIDTNLTGAFYTLKASLDELIKHKGYYITISSLAGTNFFAGGTAYNASKFGLTGFTQSAMLDLRGHGVKVSTVMPGSVATYFNNHNPSEADSWKIQIEDIGQIVVDLLKMHPRTLPSKVEVRPSIPPSARK